MFIWPVYSYCLVVKPPVFTVFTGHLFKKTLKLDRKALPSFRFFKIQFSKLKKFTLTTGLFEAIFEACSMPDCCSGFYFSYPGRVVFFTHSFPRNQDGRDRWTTVFQLMTFPTNFRGYITFLQIEP